MTPAQQRDSSSGWGETTSSEVAEVIGMEAVGAVSLSGRPDLCRAVAMAGIASATRISKLNERKERMPFVLTIGQCKARDTPGSVRSPAGHLGRGRGLDQGRRRSMGLSINVSAHLSE